MWLRRLTRLAAVLVVVGSVLGTSLPTAEAGLISKKQELKMGEEAAAQLEAQYGVVHDDELQQRVEQLGQSLVAQAPAQGLTYSFKVLNDDSVNALSVPGGHIYVFRGLLEYMPSEAELAGVLGHEIGHVVHRHTVKQIEKQAALSLLSILAGVASGDPTAALALGTTASQALMAGYSRADEREADEEGFRLSTKAGYNPYSIYVTMCKLNDLAERDGNPGYGLFSSHPEPKVRMEKNRKLLEQLHITPTVTVQPDQSARVSEGSWSYTFTQTVNSDKPEYRALLLAGGLWLAKQRGPVEEGHFLTMDQELYSEVYYEDIPLLRLYGIDALGYPSISECAAATAAQLQQWARLVAQKPAPAVAK